MICWKEADNIMFFDTNSPWHENCARELTLILGSLKVNWCQLWWIYKCDRTRRGGEYSHLLTFKYEIVDITIRYIFDIRVAWLDNMLWMKDRFHDAGRLTFGSQVTFTVKEGHVMGWLCGLLRTKELDRCFRRGWYFFEGFDFLRHLEMPKWILDG